MDIVNLVITPVVQSLMVPVKKHLGFLFSSTKYVKDMKEKMDELNITEQGIRRDLEEAEARNHEMPHHALPWLEKAKELNEKAQSIPTGRIGCFNVTKSYKAGKQSNNILKEIQALEEKSEMKFTSRQKPLAEVVSSSIEPSTSTLSGTQNNFESRDFIFKAALNSLQSNDESQKMIALCGMGGVGKTTMMEQLKKVVEDSKTFDWVVKVVVGENSNPIALQQAIAEYIREDLKEDSKEARADHLGKIFEGKSKQGKKTLVIMDDLWSQVDLKDFGLSPLLNGFKVLFTSRYEQLCTTMGVKPNSIFKVGVLNDAEAKTLFFETVDDHQFQKVGEGIVKKCRGLPIALVTIARILRGNIEEVWKRALARLEEDNLEDLKDITHRIFEMSYENLKEDNDKAVFLLSGLFRDDFDIRIEDLLRFGWGLGFFKDAKNLAQARSDMKICINNLIRANLLTESEKMGCVRMHDLVRAFVLSNFSKVNQASIVNRDNESEKRLTKEANEFYDRILLNCMSMTTFPTDFNYPNLSLLILMDMNMLLKFPEDIYERMEKLQVVSYENMSIPSHLLMFEHSNKLRTLCLRSCSFINDDATFLGCLSNLETLSFIDCKLSKLPSTIGKLKKLKLLDLTGCVHLRIDDGVFQNLSSLEELYMRTLDNRPIRFTDANCDELKVISPGLSALELAFFQNIAQPKNVSFKTLERFRISIGCQLKELEDGEKYSFRNTIKFVSNYNELLECKISGLFNKTEELYLEVNDMSYLEDVSFCYLTILHVSKCIDLTYLFTYDVASGLNKLERLIISECPAMRTLIAENSRDGVIKFQKLNFMSLTSLPKMVSFWENVIELPEMVKLKLEDLPNFTSIYPQTPNNSEMQSLLNKKVVIPKLEELTISRMMNLKQIWSCETTTQENNFSMLRMISVRECDNLMNLFPCNPLPLLSHLEELDVRKCGSIEVLFNIDFESFSKSNMSRLRSIKVGELGKLKELWRMKGVNNSDILISCFKGVEDIKIKNCSIFKDIFTPTTSNFDLGALTKYTIRNSRQKINATSTSEIDDYIPSVTYPSYLLHTCHQLQYLRLLNDERVEEVVFEMDSQPPLLLLPYLKELHLQGLKEMIHVWKCNWNEFLIPPPFQFPFQNLTKIVLYDCDKIKYLFSPLMAKFLSNLKEICIVKCDGIEEVVLWRDEEENTSTTFFPCLERLDLGGLALLNRVDTFCSKVFHQSRSTCQVIGGFWSLCQYPRAIFIEECHALSSVIPWYALGQMKRLECIDVMNCERMMEVFETTINVDEGSTSLTYSNMTNILVPQLSNLKIVSIIRCDLVQHIFTFSTLESLKQLKRLKVIKCKEIQVVIVKEENETSSENVVFPRLESLVLVDLPSLKGFFLGMNEFRWPSLEYVKINDCPQLMMFTAGVSKTPKLKHIHTSFGKHSLECGLNFHETTINELQTTSPSYADPFITKGIPWALHNLIEIQKRFRDDETIIPSHALPQLQKLQPFHIESSKAKEVFESEGSGFNESHIVVKIPNLTQVELSDIYNLKYLWKSNQWMVLEFPNLTTVSIYYCNNLEHVFTCSMVGSLVQLQDLQISRCRNIKIIVKEEEEKEYDGKVNEIMLPHLKSLKLSKLPSLNGFCLGKEDFSWPSLDTLEIRDCLAITVFTKGNLFTPNLKVIDTSFGKHYVKPDINSFIKIKQEEGYEF